MNKKITFTRNGEKYRFTTKEMADISRHLPQPHRDVLVRYYGLFDGKKEGIDEIMEFYEEYENCPYTMTPERIKRVLNEALNMAAVDLEYYKPTSKPRTLEATDYYYEIKLPLANRHMDYCCLRLVPMNEIGRKNLELIDASKIYKDHVELDYVMKHREGLMILDEIGWSDIDYMFRRSKSDKEDEEYLDLLRERFGFADFCIAPKLSDIYRYKGILFFDGTVIENKDDYYLNGITGEAERFIKNLNYYVGKPVVADMDLSDPKADEMLKYTYLNEKDAAQICFFNTFFMSDMAEM